MVARAKTGSGKTYAYLLPMLQKLLSEASQAAKAAPRAVVLVPTRELTQQVILEALAGFEKGIPCKMLIRCMIPMVIVDLSAVSVSRMIHVGLSCLKRNFFFPWSNSSWDEK